MILVNKRQRRFCGPIFWNSINVVHFLFWNQRYSLLSSLQSKNHSLTVISLLPLHKTCNVEHAACLLLIEDVYCKTKKLTNPDLSQNACIFVYPVVKSKRSKKLRLRQHSDIRISLLLSNEQ